MATLTQIIKDLQEIADSSGASSNRGRAATESKRLVELAKKINKIDDESLKQKKSLLEQARNQFRLGTKEYDQIEKQVKIQGDLIKGQEKLEDLTKKVGKSFIGLGKAAFEGSGSISAFTDNLGKPLSILGNRLDVNIETFRQLSQTGANFGQSIISLREAAATATLPLDDFAKLVGQNATSLSALFGSTTQGARGIAELGAAVRDQGVKALAPLGFTVDEINETLLLNLESQRKTGVFDANARDKNIKSSIAFATELDRLAKLTGQQRDQLRSQIESAMSNERFAVALQGQTEETRQRLQAFAGTVGSISPALAEGFQDLIANGGVAVTDAARDIVQNVPQAGALVNQLISGTLSSEEALVRLRDISAQSVNRFSKATVTGQVEFLRLQGGFIELGRRVTDTGAVLDEQSASVSSLTQNLTTFEQASKVLSSQFQGIETALLKSFGPALGGLVGGLQGLMGGLGGIASTMANAPMLTGTAIAGILAGKFLFDKGSQIAIIAAGTAIGFGKSGVLSRLGGAAGTVGKGAGRLLPGLGAAIGIGSSLSMMASDDKDQQSKGKAGLGGAAAGALIGTMIAPGVGTLIGAGIGSMAGQMFGGGKQFGGGMDTGKTYLTGEAGPELVTPRTASSVTANNDLQKIFNTAQLEAQMATMNTALASANQNLAKMVNGVNTLVAVEGRALKAVESTARKDRNQVGMI